MAQIGTFTPNEDGSFAGVIKTLNLNIKARLVVAEKESEKSPDLRALQASSIMRSAGLCGVLAFEGLVSASFGEFCSA